MRMGMKLGVAHNSCEWGTTAEAAEGQRMHGNVTGRRCPWHTDTLHSAARQVTINTPLYTLMVSEIGARHDVFHFQKGKQHCKVIMGKHNLSKELEIGTESTYQLPDWWTALCTF